MKSVQELGLAVKAAAHHIRIAPEAQKNKALAAISKALRTDMEIILEANQRDLARAEAAGMDPSMQDRLRLTSDRICRMSEAVETLIHMKDPVGQVIEEIQRPNGLTIQKVRVPLGVIGIIFEARPNVTVDAAVLCLKAGNGVLLRGGKEAIDSNRALAACMQRALKAVGLPADLVTLIEDTRRQSAQEMMRLRGILDVLIPRGGAGLIQAVTTQAQVPVIETGVGNCHIYVDETADLAMALSVVVNAKTSRPSVCNAAESLLVHKKVAEEFLPKLAKAMPQVVLYGCEKACTICPQMLPASEEDYAKEYLGYEMSVKVVGSLEEAVSHIGRYSTGHSEAIMTQNPEAAQKFIRQVDSAAVYVNASTRFTDGGEFGMGAEIGISTQKLHARGPMGLVELTSYQYVIQGTGQIRE